jgi:hypothetical protein
MNLGLICLHLLTYLGNYKSVPIGINFLKTAFLLVCHIIINELLKSIAYCYCKNPIKVHTLNRENINNKIESIGDRQNIRLLIIGLSIIQFIVVISTLVYFSNIQTYYNLFFLYLLAYQLICIGKILLILETWTFVVDLIEIFIECYFLHVLLFISYTDPYEPRSRSIFTLFADSFMQYIQTYCFIVFLRLVNDYGCLDKFLKSNQFTFVSVVGEYDLMKYLAFCLIIHYYFSFFNCFSISYKYLFNFISVPISYFILNKLSKKQRKEAKIACYLILIYTIIVQTIITGSYKENNLSFKISPFLNNSRLDLNYSNSNISDIYQNSTDLNYEIINKLKNEL